MRTLILFLEIKMLTFIKIMALDYDKTTFLLPLSPFEPLSGLLDTHRTGLEEDERDLEIDFNGERSGEGDVEREIDLEPDRFLGDFVAYFWTRK